jgi:hypothetical protein
MKAFFKVFEDLVDMIVTMPENTALPVGAGVLFALDTFVTKYIFSDMEYLIFLFVIICADLIAKISHIRKMQDIKFSFRSLLGGFFDKTLKYMAWLVMVHVLVHFTVGSEQNGWFDPFQKTLLAVLIAKECISIANHIGFSFPDKVQALIDSIIPKKDDDDESI